MYRSSWSSLPSPFCEERNQPSEPNSVSFVPFPSEAEPTKASALACPLNRKVGLFQDMSTVLLLLLHSTTTFFRVLVRLAGGRKKSRPRQETGMGEEEEGKKRKRQASSQASETSVENWSLFNYAAKEMKCTTVWYFYPHSTVGQTGGMSSYAYVHKVPGVL